MLKAFFLFCVLVLSMYGATGRENRAFHLKKDEFARVLIKSERPKQEKLLFWRWTLYTDKALVVHTKYDHVVSQHILYLGHNSSFSKRLLNASKSERDVPYAVVVFKKFDDMNKTAEFDLLIIDNEKRVLVDYLNTKEKP